MEEPFRKRPRLSIFHNQSINPTLDEDLDTRRVRNDHLLKSRFESIFEKYSQDFTGVGDEIDLVSGEVVVNNGHLEAMENEMDLGLDTPQGRALLRAMTETDALDDPYFNEAADDVMLSIEEIASSFPNDDDHGGLPPPEDSDEELFGTTNLCTLAPFATPPDSRDGHPSGSSMYELNPIVSESDPDSLFEEQHMSRSESPDSLFGSVEPAPLRSGLGQIPEALYSNKPIPAPAIVELDEDLRHSSLLARYGPEIGQEIFTMIEETRNQAEAHIEPAWRIPSNVIPPRITPEASDTRGITSQQHTQSPAPAPVISVQRSPEKRKSLWAIPNQRKNRKPPMKGSSRHTRAESEDPLQDGFASEHDVDSAQDEHTSDGSSYEEANFKRVRPEDEDEQLRSMRTGHCPYCQRKWKTRSGVVDHWSRIVRKADANGDDGVHDMNYIRDYRQRTKIRSVRKPRLTVSDFRTMVELHEGAGLSFDEIVDVGALRTRKVGAALCDAYDRYRMPAEMDQPSKDWTDDDIKMLCDLCDRSTRDLGSLTKALKRSDTDVGAKLAELWLLEMGHSVQGLTAKRGVAEQGVAGDRHANSSAGPVFVKTEDSDDDLFDIRTN
ncbi:hypothetical protein PV10_07906 [Exophiala mesophila]|uniref:Uncharacterized protein n=1 Tax=Exophiala mesophila TaxID=212818 RepID=A0A0D1XRA8_EXOME|nr:uncharacterized protein PV10_07906 [Exophiala mesophila]KIV90621.1 hypothetical protein PV10_07906 [Exophiala mesophila]